MKRCFRTIVRRRVRAFHGITRRAKNLAAKIKHEMGDAAQLVLKRTSVRPRVGIVLGSGLGAFADSLVHAVRIPYRDLPGLPASTAVGHAGELVLGTLGANGSRNC